MTTTEARLQEIEGLLAKATVIDENDPNASFHLGMQLFGPRDTAEIEGELQEHLQQLSTQLQEIIGKEGDSPSPSPPIKRNAQQLQERLDLLKVCSQVRIALDESLHIHTQDLPQALKLLQEAPVLPQNSNDPIVLELQGELRAHKVHLQNQICKQWLDSVQLTVGNLTVRSIPSLQQAHRAGVPQHVRQTFLRKINTDIFQPLLERSQTYQLQEFHHAKTHRLEWTTITSNIENNKSSKAEWSSVFAFLQTFLAFLSQYVFQEQPELCQWVGQRLLGPPKTRVGDHAVRLGPHDDGFLLEPLLHGLVNTTVPEFLQPSAMSQRLDEIAEQLDQIVQPFLQQLVASGYLEQQQTTQLDKFVANFEQAYVDNRHCIYLNKARALLLENDYHNTMVVGVEINNDDNDEDTSFVLHRSSVSDTAYQLLKLCRQAMEEAVAQPLRPADSPLGLLPATLYRAAREMLDLYRALIPAKAATDDRTAAIHHNDGVFLAHHCLTLGLEYRQRFPKPSENDNNDQDDDPQGQLLRQSCMFVDMVPLFRNMADTALQAMIQRHHPHMALNYLAESLASNEHVAEWSQAEAAWQDAQNDLVQIQQILQPILSKSILDRCLSYWLDIRLQLVTDEILRARMITRAARHWLLSLSFESSSHFRYSRNAPRWRALQTLLRLDDIEGITQELSRATFVSWTGAELSQLVQALHPNNAPGKDQLLQLLSQSGNNN